MRRPLLVAVAALLTVAPVAATAQIAAAEYAARREKLMAALGDGVFVLQGADEPEADYLSFWQSPQFEYLTGLHEPSAAMVLVKRGERLTQFLFTETKDPAREVWTGNRLGPDRARLVGPRPVLERRELHDFMGREARRSA